VPDSFGKPLPGCEIKILGENDEECLPDEIGEICIRGDIVFKGYFNHDAATKKALRNNWFHSGDYGKKDRNGFIYFQGVKKNMINVAGNKVYPKYLERLMQEHKNVMSVNIFGEPSLLQDKIVGAKIVLAINTIKCQEELKLWCKQHINQNILPKVWQFEN
jgi:acyl-CoA synthetase (AMP-forming)/AMP-acid ligase II